MTEDFKRTCYERYVMQWLLARDVSIYDIVEAMDDEYSEASYSEEILSPYFAFQRAETNGFGSPEIYVCFDEFMREEFLDREYMLSSILKTDEEIQMYEEERAEMGYA